MSEDLRSLNARIGTVGRIAAGVAVIGVVVFLASLRGLSKALTTPSAQQAKATANEKFKKVAAEYALAVDGQVKQFNGRSVFFVPSAPIPPTPPEQPKPIEVVKQPEKAPPPTSYGGPKIIGMVNGVAWFDDGKKMSVGDQLKDKLKVTKVNAPWGATVEWDGVEFEVSLFSIDLLVYPPPKKEEPKASATEASKDSPVKEPAKETPPPDIKSGDKPDSPKPEAPGAEPPKPAEPKPETPKPEAPDAPKPDQPDAPKPEQPKTDKPDSPGSPEGQIEMNE